MKARVTVLLPVCEKRVEADWLLGTEFCRTSEPKESEKRWLNYKSEHVAVLPTLKIVVFDRKVLVLYSYIRKFH